MKSSWSLSWFSTKFICLDCCWLIYASYSLKEFNSCELWHFSASSASTVHFLKLIYQSICSLLLSCKLAYCLSQVRDLVQHCLNLGFREVGHIYAKILLQIMVNYLLLDLVALCSCQNAKIYYIDCASLDSKYQDLCCTAKLVYQCLSTARWGLEPKHESLGACWTYQSYS